MELNIFRSDAAQDFRDPSACPLATVLRRHGYEDPICGTIEASFTGAKVWVSGVYLNGEKIDHPAMGLGPNEIKQIRRAFDQDPSAHAHITLVNLN